MGRDQRACDQARFGQSTGGAGAGCPAQRPDPRGQSQARWRAPRQEPWRVRQPVPSPALSSRPAGSRWIGAVFDTNSKPSVIALSMQGIISVDKLSKTYASGLRALKDINLEIRRGEIFALLGPNGAGKTTLIGTICGIVNPSAGCIRVDGRDIVADYRAARSLIGLVPQELTTDAFETVWNTVSFSRGLFGKPATPDHVAKVLKDLSLWDKKDNKIMTPSGGMIRRLLIAKSLFHDPQRLFLY